MFGALIAVGFIVIAWGATAYMVNKHTNWSQLKNMLLKSRRSLQEEEVDVNNG